MQYGDVDQSSACLRGLQIAEGKETGIKQAGNFIYQVDSQNSTNGILSIFQAPNGLGLVIAHPMNQVLGNVNIFGLHFLLHAQQTFKL